ncbi:MAG: helix-turn-helix transcriptional regulator [Cyanothece sp. SIO1E1]|nr:helix-turn-helix transcriptional regulator [Cyanothece sp. SIO1E1]
MIDPRIPRLQPGESPLKAIREALGYSQQEFATIIGVAIATISRWENGHTPATFTVPQMKALSRELRKIGMTVDNLPDDLGPTPAETK